MDQSPVTTPALQPIVISKAPGDGPAWQIMRASKRARVHSISPEVATSNRFAVLSQQPTTSAQDAKPPPIMLPNIASITDLIQQLASIAPPPAYTHQTINSNGTVKIHPATSDDYRRIVKFLDANDAQYHTYQLKEQRAFRVVLKSLHPSTPTTDIESAITEKGYRVRNVINVRHSKTRDPLPLFFVDLDPAPNNPQIYKLDLLLNAKITFEPHHKKTGVPQCTRCQRYGHTKNFCRRAFRCVKCGQEHKTAECKKSKDLPAVCALCTGSHPSNYKGCTVYQDLLRKRRPLPADPPPQPGPRNPPSASPPQPPLTRTYAQAAKPDTSHDVLTHAIHTTLQELKAVLLQQTELINNMVKLLTTFITRSQ